MNIIKSILLGFATIASLFSPQSYKAPVMVSSAPQAQLLGDFNPARGKTYNLQSSIGTTNTTIPLSSFKEPISGTPFTMALLNTTIAYGTLDPQQPSRAELVSFTGITQNSDGTALLTGVTRGLSGTYPYASSATFKLSHAGQSIFILSDAPQVFAQYPAKVNTETISGSWNFTQNPNGVTATSSTQFVTLNQVNSIAVQGAATSTETRGGIVELGTLAEQASSYNGGVAQPTVLQTKNSTSTCQVVGSYNIVASTTTGKLDKGCFDQTISYSFSGNNSFSASTTLTATTSISAGSVSSNPLKLNGIAYAFPSSQPSFPAVLRTDGAGNLSWKASGPYAYATTTSVSTTGFATSTSFTIPAGILSASSTIAVRGAGTCGSGGSGSCVFYLRTSSGTTISAVTYGQSTNSDTFNSSWSGITIGTGISSQVSAMDSASINTSASVTGKSAGAVVSTSQTSALDFSQAVTLVGVIQASTATAVLSNMTIVVTP